MCYSMPSPLQGDYFRYKYIPLCFSYEYIWHPGEISQKFSASPLNNYINYEIIQSPLLFLIELGKETILEDHETFELC